MRKDLTGSREASYRIFWPLVAGSIPLILAFSNALCDEVYVAKLVEGEGSLPNLVYEADVEPHAIWVYADGSTRFYMTGMAGIYTGRTQYDGIYARYNTDGEVCQDSIHDHNGETVHRWGKLVADWSSDETLTIKLYPCAGPLDPSLTIVVGP
jgi:hypothetical protein